MCFTANVLRTYHNFNTIKDFQKSEPREFVYFKNTIKDFQKSEPRAFVYDLALEMIEEAKKRCRKTHEHWLSNEKTIKAILVLLYSWNSAFPKTKTLSQKNILELIEPQILQLDEIMCYTITSFPFECEQTTGILRRIYEDFSDKLKPVGASKALSILNPSLFVMWDNAIRNKCIIEGISQGTPENYITFLKGIKEVIRISELPDEIDGLPIAKRIDEFHFMTYTRRQQARMAGN